MKKNDLIKKLQAIKGNPDIVIWDGLVCDFMHIGEIQHTELFKQCFEHVKMICSYRYGENGHVLKDVPPTDEEIKEMMKSRTWEFPNPYADAKTRKEWYGKNKKTIFMLVPKLRGKTYQDRLGNISY